MYLKKAAKNGRKIEEAKGYVLFGSVDDGSWNGKWFERWYATEEKARAVVAQKGWTLEHSEAHGKTIV